MGQCVGAVRCRTIRDWEVPGVVEIVHSPRTWPGCGRPRWPGWAWLGLDRTFRALARLGKEPPVLEDDVRFRVSAPSVGARMQRDELHAQRVLTRMAEHGLLTASPGTARRTYPRYSLTPAVVAGMRAAVTYRTGSLEADDAKLIRHLRRYGQIANENVRAYLDCDVSTARNRLTRLRTRGLIDFAPDSPRRGSGVQYVATSAIDSSADV
jgi:ATP-dependent DNA helicase RecG